MLEPNRPHPPRPEPSSPIGAHSLHSALRLALDEARHTVGATAPNPPVGACALDSQGNVLSVQAHQGAGSPHAEARVLEDCQGRGILHRIHTLAITLEPCNHHGRTPPCTEAILAVKGIKRVIYGAHDPNPKVSGNGAARLREAGLDVGQTDTLRTECEELIQPFARWAKTGMPWVTIKTAFLSTDNGMTMIPPVGRKTFASPSSLRLAHELRRRSDAIITGSGTVVADNPEFTVRHVADHPGKVRWLLVMDRREQTPESWLNAASSRGLRAIRWKDSFEQALKFLGEQGCLEVLVEAGPTLSNAVLAGSLWNHHVSITSEASYDADRVETRTQMNW